MRGEGVRAEWRLWEAEEVEGVGGVRVEEEQCKSTNADAKYITPLIRVKLQPLTLSKPTCTHVHYVVEYKQVQPSATHASLRALRPAIGRPQRA